MSPFPRLLSRRSLICVNQHSPFPQAACQNESGGTMLEKLKPVFPHFHDCSRDIRPTHLLEESANFKFGWDQGYRCASAFWGLIYGIFVALSFRFWEWTSELAPIFIVKARLIHFQAKASETIRASTWRYVLYQYLPKTFKVFSS